jgi:two-component system, cell cycle sensor histidine kinase and response regulator CckA
MNAAEHAVLVIEDDSAMAELERRALGRAGFAPQVVASAAEARDRLAGGRYAAVLLDYNLPDGDAWSLVRLARGRRPPIPVIMVTAMGSETVAADAVLHGVSEYIRKSDGFFERLGGAVERAARQAAADEEMRNNDSLFRAIAENAHDAILLLDGTGTILFASAAAETMLGETPAALIGRHLADFIRQEDRADWRQGGLVPPLHGATHPIYRLKLRGGHIGAVEPAFATIGEGDAARTLGVLRDVTARVRLEERVRHQQRMAAIGRLAGGMAHDFNNILGVVIGNLDLLRDRTEVGETVRELAQDALDAAVRGAELTHGMLAFARRQDLRPVLADVNASVRSIARLLGRVLGEDISIELRLTDDVWPVSVDRVQLETALTNLAANARDAMPRGGCVVIATRNQHLDVQAPQFHEAHAEPLPGDYALIEVSDTGIGMPPDVLGHAFEPFYTTKDPGRGTGLGLAMVFGFVRQSGGLVSADSQVGRGTTFRLYFPRAAPSVVEHTATPLRPSAGPIGDGRTILVVEDNEKLRQLTVRRLVGACYRVLAAEDAAAAIDIINGEQTIDLLFTDIVMEGGVNGYDLARLATVRRPELRVLLTSGFADLHAAGEIPAPSRHRLLHKPYRSDDLLRAIRAALD